MLHMRECLLVFCTICCMVLALKRDNGNVGHTDL